MIPVSLLTKSTVSNTITIHHINHYVNPYNQNNRPIHITNHHVNPYNTSIINYCGLTVRQPALTDRINDDRLSTTIHHMPGMLPTRWQSQVSMYNQIRLMAMSTALQFNNLP